MSNTGVRTASFSALANGDAIPSEDDAVFSVAEYVPDWVDTRIDKTLTSFSPPRRVTAPYERVLAAAEDDPDVENPSALAWDQVAYEEKYRQHIGRSKFDTPISKLVERCQTQTVWLVSHETDNHHSHRRLLAEYLEENGATNVGRLGYGGHVDDACAEGTHRFVSNPNARYGRVCEACNLCEQTITTALGQTTTF